jgi:hypothetical protein
LPLHKAGNNSFTWSADFDGRDYPVSGNPNPNSDHVALRRLHKDAFEATYKKAGKAVMVSVFTALPGGKEMSASNTYPDRNGKMNYVSERTGGSPSGANPFVGTWTTNYDKAQSLTRYTVSYEPDGKDGVRCSTSASGTAWAGQFDGKEYPVTTKYRAWSSIALRRIDAHTFEVTGRRAKTGPETWRISVSPDNSQLTLDAQGSWSSGARLIVHEVFKRQ